MVQDFSHQQYFSSLEGISILLPTVGGCDFGDLRSLSGEFSSHLVEVVGIEFIKSSRYLLEGGGDILGWCFQLFFLTSIFTPDPWGK